MPHDLTVSFKLTGQRGGIEHRKPSVGELKRGLQHVGHRASVAEEIDPSRGGGRRRDAQIHDLVHGVILVRKQVATQAGAVIPPAAPAEEAFQAEPVTRIGPYIFR